MSRPAQTPAPSRRFVHPSSSAVQPSTTKKAAPPFSQVRASGTSASPAGRASQFSARGRGPRDEITTSFGDDEASPSLPPRTTAHLQAEDELYDSDGPLEEHQNEPVQVPTIESASTTALPESEDSLWHGTNFETPIPKRRKVAHATTVANEPILVSSSPSEPTPESPVARDAEYTQDRLSPAGLVTPQIISRFRASATATVLEAARSSKPAFKATDQSSMATAEVGAVLPEAFTPSRKKGKHDYMPGGFAATVRNWVLEVSTNEIQRGAKDEREVVIKEAGVDKSGRAIAALDDSGRHWLLMGSQPWGSSSTWQEIVDRINRRRKVLVRGAATNWTVPLHQYGRGSDVQVAGHWDLPP